jgi:hypothetical protein
MYSTTLNIDRVASIMTRIVPQPAHNINSKHKYHMCQQQQHVLRELG